MVRSQSKFPHAFTFTRVGDWALSVQYKGQRTSKWKMYHYVSRGPTLEGLAKSRLVIPWLMQIDRFIADPQVKITDAGKFSTKSQELKDEQKPTTLKLLRNSTRRWIDSTPVWQLEMAFGGGGAFNFYFIGSFEEVVCIHEVEVKRKK